jgi:hypothetical protein
LLPVGVALLFASFHMLNALARACGRWTVAWLRLDAGVSSHAAAGTDDA